MQLAVAPMPSSHADIRSGEILAAVRQTFVTKGFDGASMQDLARAAGMSVGNFYRYFPSKVAIIQAMILRDAKDIERDFAAVIASPDPLAALRAGITERILNKGCDKDSELWAEIEAASRRSPEIAEAGQQIELHVITNLISVFAKVTGLDLQEAQRRFSARAAYILVLIKAASCLSCASPLDQGQVRAMLLGTIDRALDEVAAAIPAK
jgi:AcrR family transcriptional regulator